MKYIRDFRDKDWVSSYSLLRAKKVVEKDGREPYLYLTLGDRTGDIEARLSLDSANIAGEFAQETLSATKAWSRFRTGIDDSW